MWWKVILGLSLVLAIVGFTLFTRFKSYSSQIVESQVKVVNDPAQEYQPALPNLDKIFASDHKWIATLSAERVRTIIATGDVIPARSVNSQVLRHGDFKWPFLETDEFTKNADITFINLETPLIRNCLRTEEGLVFCGNSGNVEGLTFAGVDVANLANNHAGNHGKDGVDETVALLQKNGIDVTGVHGPLIKNIKGLKFAFLGYDDITKVQPGIENADDDLIKKEITEARSKADVVIIQFHWGVEYRDQPDDRQKYLGHLAIDSGADLVIGNHPHWIQPVEFYKGKLITYAHGNYIFDQMWSEKTEEGILGKYTFYDNQLVDVQYFPIKIRDYGQAYFPSSSEGQKILDNMKTQSKILNNLN